MQLYVIITQTQTNQFQIIIIFINLYNKSQMTIFDRLLDRSEDKTANEVDPDQKQNNFIFCLNAKQYFNIEQQDIIMRAKSAIFLKPCFHQVIQSKPDLYGPFWISTTLILLLIASSSLVMMFNPSSSVYDFNQIHVATGLVYGISFGCPYLIAIVMKFMGSTLSVIDLICIYGYSLTVFLPITALCFINNDMIQIALLIVGFAVSTVFLIRGVLRQIVFLLQVFIFILSMDRNLGQKEKMVIGMLILSAQFLLVLMYKFYFFKLY